MDEVAGTIVCDSMSIAVTQSGGISGCDSNAVQSKHEACKPRTPTEMAYNAFSYFAFRRGLE